MWNFPEKRAWIVCYGSRHPSSTEVYPDTQHEVKHDGENGQLITILLLKDFRKYTERDIFYQQSHRISTNIESSVGTKQ